ncbi:unnamed protein product [Chondrus crispus]|uniref:Uncharacterized protein n=1 Tax=Chondrus crispus TaxID=2769 RepID=R7Q799_CHOCR|nr:unnamed protein product [Chondrus crispus]CDF33345.1 unnamed protein product [Chondrus crispus]|eukprot:XP_005713148.1 unnamed protein product [Chondrus crispus]
MSSPKALNTTEKPAIQGGFRPSQVSCSRFAPCRRHSRSRGANRAVFSSLPFFPPSRPCYPPPHFSTPTLYPHHIRSPVFSSHPAITFQTPSVASTYEYPLSFCLSHLYLSLPPPPFILTRPAPPCILYLRITTRQHKYSQTSPSIILFHNRLFPSKLSHFASLSPSIAARLSSYPLSGTHRLYRTPYTSPQPTLASSLLAQLRSSQLRKAILETPLTASQAAFASLPPHLR